MVGGDVAYENAMRSCYRCWDLWLADWEERMVTPQGYTVPMVVNVGNHDAGTNTLDNAFASLCKGRVTAVHRVPLVSPLAERLFPRSPPAFST